MDKPSTTKSKILIVDDDASVRNLIQRFLSRKYEIESLADGKTKYEIESAADGKTACLI